MCVLMQVVESSDESDSDQNLLELQADYSSPSSSLQRAPGMRAYPTAGMNLKQPSKGEERASARHPSIHQQSGTPSSLSAPSSSYLFPSSSTTSAEASAASIQNKIGAHMQQYHPSQRFPYQNQQQHQLQQQEEQSQRAHGIQGVGSGHAALPAHSQAAAPSIRAVPGSHSSNPPRVVPIASTVPSAAASSSRKSSYIERLLKKCGLCVLVVDVGGVV